MPYSEAVAVTLVMASGPLALSAIWTVYGIAEIRAQIRVERERRR